MIQRLLLLSVVFFWLSSSSYSEEYTYDGQLTQDDIDQGTLYGSPDDIGLMDEGLTYMDQIIVQDDYEATTGCLLVQTRTWNGTTGGECANGISGTYTFGYGQTVIAQTQDAIAEALKIAGITVVGYRWQWRVKNADTNYYNEQNQANADPLVVMITVKDKDGNVLDKREWDYSYYIYDWEQKYGMEWFDPFISGDDIDTITLEVGAYDAGNWAGYYGPEFGSASIYSLFVVEPPDPCEQIPIVDPTCEGFIGEAPAEDPAVKQLVIIESTGSIPLSADELAVLESLEEEPEAITQEQAVVEEAVEDKPTNNVDALAVANSAVSNALSDASNIIDNTIQQQDNGMPDASGNVSVESILAQSLEQNIVNFEVVIEDSFEVASTTTAIESALSNIMFLETSTIAEQREQQEEREEEAQEESQESEEDLVAAALAGDDSEDAQAALLGYNPNFAQYQQPQMTDASFYDPKEIYEGQRTFDNPAARFFNGASDATHREMVRQQYEGN